MSITAPPAPAPTGSLAGRRIVFRCDASQRIGSGHVMRCLTLAGHLRQQQAECLFVCREHPGHLLALIRARGFVALVLPAPTEQATAGADSSLAHADWLGVAQEQDAQECLATLQAAAMLTAPIDWLVVDHYALDHRWERLLRPHCRRLLVIDDLADRAHDCDLLLDQNLGRTPADYATQLPALAIRLIGPRYALLREEFAAWRSASLARHRSQPPEHLLIALGGVDQDNLSGQLLAQLEHCALPATCRVTVVLGRNAPHLAALRRQASQLARPCQVLAGIDNMAEALASCDLALGAAGGSAWERVALGVPTLLLILADNQRDGAAALVEHGLAIALNGPEQLADGMATYALQAAQLQQKLNPPPNDDNLLIDAQGCRRIGQRLHALLQPLTIRPANAADEALLLAWANDPKTRANAFNPRPIAAAEHHGWLQRVLAEPTQHRLFIMQHADGQALGQIRFDRRPDAAGNGDAWELSYALAPATRGQSLGARLIAEGCQALWQALGQQRILARTLADNQTSRQILGSLGFSETQGEDGHRHFVLLPDRLPKRPDHENS